MGCRWNPIGFQFFCFLFVVIGLQIRCSWSLNSEGFALLKFRARVDSDPHGTFMDWNANDSNPCSWSGVCCLDGKVKMLDLSNRSLEGTLAPELGQLSHLRSLVLYKNHFFGYIPREFGALAKLELLDLRNNNLTGKVPAEFGRVLSLKRLLLCGNKFEGSMPMELTRLVLLSELQFDGSQEPPSAATGFGCAPRKFGHCIWRNSFRQVSKARALMLPIKGTFKRYINVLPLTMFGIRRDTLTDRVQNYEANLPSAFGEHMAVTGTDDKTGIFLRRRLLDESSNLPAAPASGSPSPALIPLAIPRSSGAFPAVPNAKKKQPFSPAPSPSEVVNFPKGSDESSQKPLQTEEKSSVLGSTWFYVIIIAVVVVVLIVMAIIICICRKRAAKSIGPWKTGLSGQLQKAFVSGVPKLNRSELETACEDFSNIVHVFDGYTVYKGTLSSGVEIAVASTAISSVHEWSRAMEMAYRRKIDTLSRINHKNFVNLIGYCEEGEPFNRMMVFEYAPNGTLYEHLHDEEMEHLDWNARMRIVMGMGYCLQYMHDLNPPVAHTNLNSSAIYLTDDYAAKVAEVCFNSETGLKKNTSGSVTSGGDEEHSILPPLPEPETNVYSYGVLLLEIISGKLPYSDEDGSIEQWASKYLNREKDLSDMVDPTLKSFKQEELEVICNLIQECITRDPRQRPTMKDIITQLREVINISPEQATPRLSPLWWAELEILSSEAT